MLNCVRVFRTGSKLWFKLEERTLGFVEIVSPNSIPNADWKVHLLCRFDKFQTQTRIRIGIVVGCFSACCHRMVWFFSQVKKYGDKNIKLIVGFKLYTEKVSKVSWIFVKIFFLQQATAGCRRPRPPRFPYFLILFWESWVLFQMFAHQEWRPYKKTRTSATTIRTGMRDSMIQDGEDVDILRSPVLEYFQTIY